MRSKTFQKLEVNITGTYLFQCILQQRFKNWARWVQKARLQKLRTRVQFPSYIFSNSSRMFSAKRQQHFSWLTQFFNFSCLCNLPSQHISIYHFFFYLIFSQVASCKKSTIGEFGKKCLLKPKLQDLLGSKMFVGLGTLNFKFITLKLLQHLYESDINKQIRINIT